MFWHETVAVAAGISVRHFPFARTLEDDPLGLTQRDGREVLGQLLRLALAVPGSMTSKAPLRNTGRSTVGAFTPMPLPDDLKDVLS